MWQSYAKVLILCHSVRRLPDGTRERHATVNEAQRELLEQRYGRDEAPAGLIWNEQVEALLRHRSVRAFLPEPLPEGALETMVAAAQSASTSSNLHHWSVVAVTAPELKARLTEFTRSRLSGTTYRFVDEAPVVLLWVADNSRNHAITEERGEVAASLEYLDSFTTATIDTAIAAQNAVVAAEAIGLGAVYLGAMRNRAEELADLIGLPDHSYVAFGLAVGVPDPERAGGIRPRPPQRVVLHHDRYSPTPSAQWVPGYEAVSERFRDDQGMRPRSWTDSVVTGTSLEYLDGREELRDAVTGRGHGLG
ncbi:Nitroreductase [Actinosynnema pretiosum]|nr:Nitroreductase [Actinosynnema pretiosum]